MYARSRRLSFFASRFREFSRREYSCDPRNEGRASNYSSKLNTRSMINSSLETSEREGERQREKSEKVESSIDPFFNCYRCFV